MAKPKAKAVSKKPTATVVPPTKHAGLIVSLVGRITEAEANHSKTDTAIDAVRPILGCLLVDAKARLKADAFEQLLSACKLTSGDARYRDWSRSGRVLRDHFASTYEQIVKAPAKPPRVPSTRQLRKLGPVLARAEDGPERDKLVKDVLKQLDEQTFAARLKELPLRPRNKPQGSRLPALLKATHALAQKIMAANLSPTDASALFVEMDKLSDLVEGLTDVITTQAPVVAAPPKAPKASKTKLASVPATVPADLTPEELARQASEKWAELHPTTPTTTEAGPANDQQPASLPFVKSQIGPDGQLVIVNSNGEPLVPKAMVVNGQQGQ